MCICLKKNKLEIIGLKFAPEVEASLVPFPQLRLRTLYIESRVRERNCGKDIPDYIVVRPLRNFWVSRQKGVCSGKNLKKFKFKKY